MGTKEKLLGLLETRRGEVLSGEDIARTLGVSRAAVWKAMETLRAGGHIIDSAPGSGYRLHPGSDMLSKEALHAAFGGAPPALRVFEETDSTNIQAKLWAVEGASHGALVVAQRQHSGRGRLGRGFESPPGGLYMSVVLRPSGALASAGLLTSAAAVAACRAVAGLYGLGLSIKWVNDLYFQKKKCCGILTEAGAGLEGGELEYLVVGMGLNITTPPSAFLGAGADVAGSLFPNGGAPAPRAHLAAAIHTQLLHLFKTLPDRAFLNEYRALNFVLGQTVTVLAPMPYTAVAEAIDDEARLVVTLPDGSHRTLSYGEISIKI